MPELGRCGAEEAGLGSRGVATASSSIAIPLHRSQPPGCRSGGGGRCSLRGAAAGVCVVSVPAAPCVGDWWVAGWEVTEGRKKREAYI